VGLGGYGCLLALLVGGAVSGALLGFLGIARIVRGSQEQLESGADAVALTFSLETAVFLIGSGTLLFLIAFVAGVVLAKDLLDESERARRGPL
jgi:NhaP-type Na+/H+ or K+/H+ antiporter